MSHFIPLEKAIEMNALYRSEKENILAEKFTGQNILAVCESFDRAAFDRLLAQPDCAGIRIYYGMDETLKVHAVIVGYNAQDQDILPSVTTSARSTEDEFGGVVEEGNRCPDICPPASPLNVDKP